MLCYLVVVIVWRNCAKSCDETSNFYPMCSAVLKRCSTFCCKQGWLLSHKQARDHCSRDYKFFCDFARDFWDAQPLHCSIEQTAPCIPSRENEFRKKSMKRPPCDWPRQWFCDCDLYCCVSGTRDPLYTLYFCRLAFPSRRALPPDSTIVCCHSVSSCRTLYLQCRNVDQLRGDFGHVTLCRLRSLLFSRDSAVANFIYSVPAFLRLFECSVSCDRDFSSFADGWASQWYSLGMQAV